MLFRTWAQCLTPLIIFTAAGCGTVHPEADYADAQSLASARTGSESIYSPTTEASVALAVDTLLADGLTADEAVSVALLNNKNFQAQFLEIGVSRADLVQAGLFTNPALSFSARFPSGGGRANLSFGLAQEIVDLWQIPIRKRIARAALESTVSNVVLSAIDLATRTRQAYFRARVLEETERVMQDDLALFQHTEQRAADRFNAGESTILDVNLARAEALDAQMRATSLHADVAVARAEFEHLLGLSREQFGAPLSDPLPAGMDAIDTDDALIQTALESRLDLTAAAAALDSAEVEITKERMARLPSLSVGTEAERTDNRGPNALTPLPTDTAGLSARELVLRELTDKRQRAFDRSQTIDLLAGPSLQATLPLWDGNKAQIAKARYRFEQRKKEYADLVLGVILDVTQASAALRSAGDLLRLSANESLPLAKRNVETARRVYEAGEDSILALLLAQKNYNTQREAQLRYAGDYANALFGLERAIGHKLSPTCAGSPPSEGTR